jgi:hypothetical protein
LKKFSYSLTHTNFPGLVSVSRSGDNPTLSISKTEAVKPVIMPLIRRQERLYHRSSSPAKSPLQLLYILLTLAFKFKQNCRWNGSANYKRPVVLTVNCRCLSQRGIIGRWQDLYHGNAREKIEDY